MPNQPQEPVAPNPTTKPLITKRTLVLVCVLLLVAGTWAVFHQQIKHALAVRSLLNSNAPQDEEFEELAAQDNDPVDFLNRCWATGKITHRQFVATLLREAIHRNPPWLSRAKPLLLRGAIDADASIRELMLGTLAAQKNPLLFRAAEAQFSDVDPFLRMLGLDYMKSAEPQQGLPAVIRLLDDPDRRVLAVAEVVLMRWSGEDYGVRAHMGIVGEMPSNSPPPDVTDAEIIRRGIERRKEWWQHHSKEYQVNTAPAGDVPMADFTRLPAADFALKNLRGNVVRLSDFRGKVVLVNFWATWCSACLAEIGDLNALQKRLGDRVVILGIALDGLPNLDPHEDGGDNSGKPAPSLESITAKVNRAVTAREIHYTVLLDPSGSVGGQYNGGELPATVIFDKSGRVRRRFIGERNVSVFEAMVAEAAKVGDGR
jgi:thiol-disulfide isomerase/thioredoxin